MDFLKTYKAEIDLGLNNFFDQFDLRNGELPEKKLLEASQYAIINGGKRIRPILALLCFELFESDPVKRKQALRVMLSLEFLHAYSLVHDDLPALDNDELRRGQPTVWKKYGEQMGILVGDFLNTLAFENIAQCAPDHCIKNLINALSVNSGINGMIGGQMRDLFFENKDFSLEQLLETHSKKTGALIVASARFGAILAEASPEKLDLVTRYAQKIGLAFQVKDDLLDIEGVESVVGKKVGKDLSSKGFIKLLGADESRKKLKELVFEAVELAQKLKSKKLEDLAIFIEQRQH